MLVRVIFDTCTIRNHLHAKGHQLDLGAIKISKEQLRFSVAGGAYVELLAQLIEGRVKWSEWSQGIPAIDSILDQRWPILPTGRQLASIAGTQTDIEIDHESEKRHLQAVWRHLRNSESKQEIEQRGSYKEINGQEKSFELSVSTLQQVGNAHRTSWKDYIQEMQKLLPATIKNPTEEVILKLMMKNQGTYPGDPPDLSNKLDAV